MPIDWSSIDIDCERDGEFGSGEMRGAIFAAGEELDGELPVGDVGETPFMPPGLLVPLFLPPRKRPLL
jgi:hypothetical protein